MARIKCCKGCEKRHESCHVNCETYIREKEAYDLEKAKEREKQRIERGVAFESITNMMRVKQKKRKQV